MPKRTIAFLSIWGVLFGSALACLGIFIHGVFRDHRVGEPVIDIDLSTRSGWMTTSFRVFGEGDYHLILSTVNHDSRYVGRPFDGVLQVQILDSDNQLVLDRKYDGATTEHFVPDNYGDTRLATFHLSEWPLRAWQLKVRVLDVDHDFQTARSEVKFWKDRELVGMGGLITYAMIVPGGIFLLLAILAALPLANRGNRIPLVTTGAAVLIFLLVLA